MPTLGNYAGTYVRVTRVVVNLRQRFNNREM
jgi:hypothetical protein